MFKSPTFWFLVRSLKDFTLNEGKGDGRHFKRVQKIPSGYSFTFDLRYSGKLPLRGSIPDMTSDSERYIQLQNVYKSQADAHVEAVINHVHDHLHSFGKVWRDSSALVLSQHISLNFLFTIFILYFVQEMFKVVQIILIQLKEHTKVTDEYWNVSELYY